MTAPAWSSAARLRPMGARSSRSVRRTMLAGSVIYQDGEFTNFDRRAVIREIESAARRFESDIAGDPAVMTLPIVDLTRLGAN